MALGGKINFTLGLVAVLLFTLALAAPAGARSSYCSPSGDFCIRITGQGGSEVVSIGTFAHRGRYTLCVTAPDRSQQCKRFRLTREAHDLFGSHVSWSRHYANKGPGVYRVRWRQFGSNLGPRLSFNPGPTMHLRPSAVRAGERIRVFGSAGGCARGNDVILLSDAFPNDREFAGVPAVFTPVRADGRFGTRIRIPRHRRPGRYTVGARCGGGNFGIFRRLQVRAAVR